MVLHLETVDIERYLTTYEELSGIKYIWNSVLKYKLCFESSHYAILIPPSPLIVYTVLT